MRRRSFLACLAAPVLPVTPVLPVAPIGVRWIGVDPAAGPGLCVISIVERSRRLKASWAITEGQNLEEIYSEAALRALGRLP